MPVYKNDFLLIENKIEYYDLDFFKKKKHYSLFNCTSNTNISIVDNPL